MEISEIDWDEKDIKHIAKHGVNLREVEEAIFESDYQLLKTKENRYVILSQTRSGRYLTIVITKAKRGRVKIITARDMDSKEKRYYRRKGK